MPLDEEHVPTMDVLDGGDNVIATFVDDTTERFGQNFRVLRPDEDVLNVRQWHRNVFAERCRLRGVRAPDEATMLAWWPGTRKVFA